MGGQARTATYHSTSANSVLFTYSVAAGDQDSDGVSIGANKLSLNGGAIVDQASNTPLTTENEWILGLGLDARVTHPALNDDSSHKVSTNSPAAGVPTITGTAQVGQTLTASTTEISDSDGLTNVTYSYQWLADDTNIDGATNATYTVQSTDNGKVIKVRVSFTDDAGSDGTSAVVVGGL